MYYEEKVINGVLHWRNTPNSDFKPFTLEGLTTALNAQRRVTDDIQEKYQRLQEKFEKLEDVFNT